MESLIKQLYSIYLKNPIISTDSRNIPKGAVFFALKGDNFDGNKFALQAIKQGASIAVVDDPSLKNENACIWTGNSLVTLQELATYHRNQLKIPIIAITGTNGKTTTKELIGHILSSQFKTYYTKGNLNNHIGVPLSILSITQEHEIAIIEIGANHLGEINHLCQIAKPNFGIITNIGKAHLEGFGNLDGVIKGKSELYKYLKMNSKSLVFVNGGNKVLLDLCNDQARKLYGSSKNNDYSFSDISSMPYVSMNWNSNFIQSTLLGLYNAENIMAAICICSHFGVDQANTIKATKSYVPKNQRSEWIEKGGNKIILDAYNANPSSMKAALSNFEEMNLSNKILLLGDMFELGEFSLDEHQNLIDSLIHKNYKAIILIGKEFAKCTISSKILHFDETNMAMDYLKENPIHDSSILIKGSRAMQMEKLLETL